MRQITLTALSDARFDLDGMDNRVYNQGLALGETSVSLSAHLAKFKHFTEHEWVPFQNKSHKSFCVVSVVADALHKSLASLHRPPSSIQHQIDLLFAQLGGRRSVTGDVSLVPQVSSRTPTSSSLPSLISNSPSSQSSCYPLSSPSDGPFITSSEGLTSEPPILIEESGEETGIESIQEGGQVTIDAEM